MAGNLQGEVGGEMEALATAAVATLQRTHKICDLLKDKLSDDEIDEILAMDEASRRAACREHILIGLTVGDIQPDEIQTIIQA